MIRRHTISFVNAFNGLKWALSTQPNYRIHLALSALSMAGSWFFRISWAEFLALLVLISVGLAFETVNTAIELTNDAVDKSIRSDIKLAKDVAAGGMLVFAAGAFVIACYIFIPRIIILITTGSVL